MLKVWRALALMMAAMLVVFMVGCGDDDDDDDDTDQPVATTVTAVPAGGSTVASNATVTLTFDQPVKAVAGATGAARTWTIPVAASLTVTWTNNDDSAGGPVTFTYTLEAPDTTPPSIAGSSSVQDGDKDVEPDPLNADGIKIDFSEDIQRGQVTLTTEAGDDLGWLPTWAANSVTLEPRAGSELGRETTYVITITGVKDTAGNDLAGGTITFVTAAKPE